MHKLVAALLAMGFILGGLGSAFCAEPKRNANKFRERIETLTMWRMMEVLDLDQETSNKILVVHRKFETKRKELEKSLGEDVHKLRALVKDSEERAGDKELASLIDNIRSKRKQLDDLRDARFTDVSKILSVRQQAKLILFLKDFRGEIRELIRSSMRHRPHGGEFRGRRGGFGGPGNEGPRQPRGDRFGPPPGGPPHGPEGRWEPGSDESLELR